MITTLVVGACVMYPLSEVLLVVSAIDSFPICVARSFIGAYPLPISVVGLCIVSFRKLCVSPITCLAALSISLSVVLSCLSVNISRWVAW